MSAPESDRHLLVAQLIGGAPTVWVGVVDVPVAGLRLDVGGVAVPLPDAWESFIGGGRTLRVPAAFDAAALRRLLAVLDGSAA